MLKFDSIAENVLSYALKVTLLFSNLVSYL